MLAMEGCCCGRKGRDNTYMSILSGILSGIHPIDLLIVQGTAKGKRSRPKFVSH